MSSIPTPTPTRIMTFSPYAAWTFHTNYETTLLHGCVIRGAEVKVLLCDGVFGECDMYNAAMSFPHGRPLNLCQSCQAAAKSALDKSGLPYEWLSSYLSEQERQEALNWAQSLYPDEFMTATFRGFPVAEWVITSAVTYFRVYPIRFDDWQTLNVYRGFLHAGAITCIALENAFEQWKPDALLMFNGRMSVTRVAFYMAKRSGIRILTHERSYRPDTLFIRKTKFVLAAFPLKSCGLHGWMFL